MCESGSLAFGRMGHLMSTLSKVGRSFRIHNSMISLSLSSEKNVVIEKEKHVFGTK